MNSFALQILSKGRQVLGERILKLSEDKIPVSFKNKLFLFYIL